MSYVVMQRTLEMLDKHHRDGAAFAAMMKEGFAQRFGPEFWEEWERIVGPALGGTPQIMDLGAGPGLLVKVLAERYPAGRVYGVECAPYMLEAVEGLPGNAEIVVQDLHDPRLPCADGSVDAVFTSMVLHEMSQPVKAMREVARCLKPGGVLLVHDWVRVPLAQYLAQQEKELRAFDPAASAEELDDLFIHFVEHNRFSADDLAYMLEATGFQVKESRLLRDGAQARIAAVKR